MVFSDLDPRGPGDNQRRGVAICGKAPRGSEDRASGTEQLHLVEGWACGQELMFGQHRSEGRTTEIETIPLLLEMLTLEGCVVPIDALEQDVCCRGGYRR